jgi:hypothetical protein
MASERIKGLVIVLGSPNSEQGELYNIAKERCELALTEYVRILTPRISLTPLI